MGRGLGPEGGALISGVREGFLAPTVDTTLRTGKPSLDPVSTSTLILGPAASRTIREMFVVEATQPVVFLS